jgi:hypothetical protein
MGLYGLATPELINFPSLLARSILLLCKHNRHIFLFSFTHGDPGYMHYHCLKIPVWGEVICGHQKCFTVGRGARKGLSGLTTLRWSERLWYPHRRSKSSLTKIIPNCTSLHSLTVQELTATVFSGHRVSVLSFLRMRPVSYVR